jgi:threonine dehydratase
MGSGHVIGRHEIEAAARLVAPYVRRTPVISLEDGLGGVVGAVDLKLEQLQVTGSFKPRGAFSLLLSSPRRPDGVVAASGGNFGLAVAYAAKRLGIRATVFVPGSSPAEKIAGISAYGAEVRVEPGFYPDALAAATAWAAEHDAVTAHAYDDRAVVAGQGTVGVELSEQVPDTDTVVVAVGGGGLIGGIASWLRDDVRVVAVETEGTAALHAARTAGQPVEVEVGGIAASSLGAGTIGDHAWAANGWIDESVLVTDAATQAAQTWLWDHARVVAEPGAATTVAALLSGAYRPERNERVTLLICGANTAPGSVTG